MINYPDYIKIQTEFGTWELLESNDQKYWESDNIAIKLVSEDEDRFQILVTSKSQKLKRIQLSWNKRFHFKTLFLGDSFERNYGETSFRFLDPERVMFWYFVAQFQDSIECFGVETQPNSFCAWQVTDSSVECICDIRNGSNAIDLSKRELNVATIVIYNEETSNSFKSIRSFCKSLHKKNMRNVGPIYGGNDWYCSYGNNSEEIIMKQALNISELSKGLSVRPYMVIDDGWQINHTNNYNGGSWDNSNSKFPCMEKMAEKISSLDVKPGLWFRPLLRHSDDANAFSKHCVLHQNKDGSIVLDPSHPDVLEMITNDLVRFIDWRFKLIKHDFTTFDIFKKWGNELGIDCGDEIINFFDKEHTSAEIIKNFYEMIQEVTNEVLVIGCNTISHLAAGIFEIQRTGDDTSGTDFNRTRKMGVNTLAFRMPQHKIFYLSDADCIGITDSIEWKENKKWCHLLSISGTPFFISCNPETLTLEMKNYLRDCFKKVSSDNSFAVPKNWEYEIYPKKWISPKNNFEYVWYETPFDYKLN